MGQGRELGELLGLEPAPILVSDDAEAVPARSKLDIVLHATGVPLEKAAPQIEVRIKQGASVVSTCEELAWPFIRWADLSGRLRRVARQRGVSALGSW